MLGGVELDRGAGPSRHRGPALAQHRLRPPRPPWEVAPTHIRAAHRCALSRAALPRRHTRATGRGTRPASFIGCTHGVTQRADSHGSIFPPVAERSRLPLRVECASEAREACVAPRRRSSRPGNPGCFSPSMNHTEVHILALQRLARRRTHPGVKTLPWLEGERAGENQQRGGPTGGTHRYAAFPER